MMTEREKSNSNKQETPKEIRQGVSATFIAQIIAAQQVKEKQQAG
jgi:hypothetical protein